MNTYQLTHHAQARIVERRIPDDWLAQVLNNPEEIQPSNHGREIRQSMFERDGKRYLLRVVVEKNLVVTAMLTSKIDKYRGEP